MSVFNILFSCREALDLLGDDLDGTLPAGPNMALRLHLYLCHNCRDYHKTYRTTTDLVRSLQDETGAEQAETLSEEMIRRILAALPESPLSPPAAG